MVACSAAAAAGAAAAAAATGPLWAQNGARAANGKGRTPEPENGVTRGAPRASAEPEQGGNIRMFPRRFCLFLACSLCPFVGLVSSSLAHTMSLLPICLLSVVRALKFCSLICAPVSLPFPLCTLLLFPRPLSLSLPLFLCIPERTAIHFSQPRDAHPLPSISTACDPFSTCPSRKQPVR